MLVVLGLVLASAAPTKDVEVRNLSIGGRPAVEERGLIELGVWKRFVLRFPRDGRSWNRKLVVGAHGGSGGESFTRDGHVSGTDETALDDVVGSHALAHGFAYASVDRDGIGGTREGLELTRAFTDDVVRRLGERFGADVTAIYLAGLSMGGGIARYAAEESPSRFDGALIIAGANGDAVTRERRQSRMEELFPRVDPRKVANPLPPELEDYARAVGTPVEARRFWPFIGATTSGSGRRFEETSGRVTVPTIEVVGTFDDFVLPEILAYKEKVREKGAETRHRLYRVTGAWHISPDDDAISSFQFAGSRLGLDEATLGAMATGASYLLVVRDALLLLDRWVSEGAPPPADRELGEGETLLR